MGINKTIAFAYLQKRIDGTLSSKDSVDTQKIADAIGLFTAPATITKFLFDSCGFNQTEAIVATAEIPASYLRMLYGELYRGNRLDSTINVLDFNTGLLNKEWLVNMEHSFCKEKS